MNHIYIHILHLTRIITYCKCKSSPLKIWQVKRSDLFWGFFGGASSYELIKFLAKKNGPRCTCYTSLTHYATGSNGFQLPTGFRNTTWEFQKNVWTNVWENPLESNRSDFFLPISSMFLSKWRYDVLFLISFRASSKHDEVVKFLDSDPRSFRVWWNKGLKQNTHFLCCCACVCWGNKQRKKCTKNQPLEIFIETSASPTQNQQQNALKFPAHASPASMWHTSANLSQWQKASMQCCDVQAPNLDFTTVSFRKL